MRFGYALLFIVAASLTTWGCAGVITPSRHPTEKYSAVFAAASSGDLATLKRDIAADPTLVTATEWEGLTLLDDAVDKGHVEAAEYLLISGANVSAPTTDGRTALHIAAQHGDVKMMAMLLDHRAAIDMVDGNGWTPLDRAITWGHQEAANFLKEHGAHTREQLKASR